MGAWGSSNSPSALVTALSVKAEFAACRVTAAPAMGLCCGSWTTPCRVAKTVANAVTHAAATRAAARVECRIGKREGKRRIWNYGTGKAVRRKMLGNQRGPSSIIELSYY